MKKIGGITLRKLMKMELKYLAGAMAVSALAVLANLLTPMILAEAVDRYFLKTASRFPASVTGWIDAVSRGYTARALTLMAAALVCLALQRVEPLDDFRRAALERHRDELAPVGLLALERHEAHARLHFPRIERVSRKHPLNSPRPRR